MQHIVAKRLYSTSPFSTTGMGNIIKRVAPLCLKIFMHMSRMINDASFASVLIDASDAS